MTWTQAIRAFWYFWAVLLIVLALAVMGRADWVEIRQFQGLSTATKGMNQDMSVAREVDGWQVRSEGLVKPWFTKFRTDPVVNTPTYILGHSATGDAVLVFADNFYRLKNDTLDNVKVRSSNRPDSGQAVNGTDSILSQFEHIAFPCADSAGRYWLNFALTDRASVVWEGQDIAVRNFYSNRWLLASKALTVQTKPMSYPVSTPSVDEGSGTLDWPDTTAIFDGRNVFLYEAEFDSIRNVNNTTILPPPVYQRDLSQLVTQHYYDTLRVLNTFELGTGDTVLAIRVNTDDSLRGGDYRRFWVLLDDTLSTSQCVPCSVAVADTTAPDSVLLTLLCDSTRFAGVNHYWGRVEGSGSPCMYAILYRPGGRQNVTPVAWVVSDTTDNPATCNWPPTYNSALAPNMRIRYEGRFGRLHYATIEVVAGTVHLPFTSALMAKKARITDSDIFQVVSDGFGTVPVPDTLSIVCQDYQTNFGSYSLAFGAGCPAGADWPHYFRFLAFAPDTIKMADFQDLTSGNVRVSAYNRPRVGGWSVTTTSSTPSPYRFATLGNLRAWAGGHDDTDSAKHIAYTDAQSHNAAGATFDYYEFDDPDRVYFSGSDRTTGLTSMGGAIVRWTRRTAWQVTGEPPTTYVQSIPIGQGAVSHWTIDRSTIHNADAIVNENGQFLFSGGGLELLTPGLREVFTDSINWAAEAKMRGAVFDNMYFVTAPWDTFTTNQKTICTDLETRQSWVMSQPRLASLWNFRDDDGSEEWFGGDADSSVLWKWGGPSSNYYFVPEWKSSWSDLGDPEAIKRVMRYRVDFEPGTYSSDTLLVDWYLDLRDTVYYDDTTLIAPAWTDTIDVDWEIVQFEALWPDASQYPVDGVVGYTRARNLLESKASQRQSVYRSVPRNVAGKHLSFGIRGTSRAAAPLTVMSFGFEYNTAGRRR